jgi:prepilin-type processing-associated H-X9-DG protein
LGTNINLDRVAPLNLIHCPSVGDIGKGGQKLTLTYTMNGVNTNSNFWKMLCIAGQATDGLLPNVAPARVRRPAEFGLLTEKWKTDGPEQCCWTTTWWRLFVANDFTCLFVHARGTRSNVLFADLHVEPLRCKPTGIDANTKYPLVNDQNDALFNYDYGALRNGGAGKPSKYLN